ncbi:MAG: ABC transporter substrate-binding protein [Burkholderiaceae bacterium]|nr:ABC transporter substrate-binding protein [Burkholderiaceae bacterium]
MRNSIFVGAIAAGLLGLAAPATAQLNVICSVQADWCNALAAQFQRESGVKVSIIQKGSGETLAQLQAESANPRTDVWFGGTHDPHIVAAERDLTQAHASPRTTELHPWAQELSRVSKGKAHGIYAGILGIGFNIEIMAKRRIPQPSCWKDLLGPEYKGEIQIANPNSSGTAYVAIATLVQIMGEEQAFEYLKGLHRNVNQYPRSGTGPIKAAARGETMASISFMHDAVTERVAGLPVKAVAPCEGTGYEIGGLSIVKGAKNLDNAKKFVDWALSAPGQRVGIAARQFQVPSNKAVAPPPEAPSLFATKLIKYDLAKYGSNDERKRLIAKWGQEVNSLPR